VLQREAVEVPSVLGLPAQSARALIESRGLMFVVGEEREDMKTPAGNVVAQRPLEGSRIERGQAVDVVVAKALSAVKAPALVGWRWAKPSCASRWPSWSWARSPRTTARR
jgi:beta-lactam-binding protein with PASTA domain